MWVRRPASQPRTRDHEYTTVGGCSSDKRSSLWVSSRQLVKGTNDGRPVLCIGKPFSAHFISFLLHVVGKRLNLMRNKQVQHDQKSSSFMSSWAGRTRCLPACGRSVDQAPCDLVTKNEWMQSQGKGMKWTPEDRPVEAQLDFMALLGTELRPGTWEASCCLNIVKRFESRTKMGSIGGAMNAKEIAKTTKNQLFLIFSTRSARVKLLITRKHFCFYNEHQRTSFILFVQYRCQTQNVQNDPFRNKILTNNLHTMESWLLIAD